MNRPRLDGLFARLMLAHMALLALMGMVLVIWLTAARADASAIPYARLWAPDLARAAISPLGVDLEPPASGLSLQRSVSFPPGTLSPNISRGPGTSRLTTELKAQGVHADDVRLGRQSGQFLLWFHVLPPGANAVWLAIPLPRILPQLTVYTGLLSLLPVGLFTLLSWRFSRRVVRPLEKLRSRMVDGTTALAGAASPPETIATASSEIVAIDAAYRQLIQRLQDAETERGLLLAGVSHDLRSPLGRIRLAAQMLPAGPETRMDVSTITRNVDHADRLIDSFLDFVSSGTLELGEQVDVVTTAAAVVERFDLSESSLSLHTQPLGAKVPLLRANTLLIDRLIFNLIDNAVKHGQPPVRVSLTADAASVHIDVCDAGPGLLEGQEHRLRQAFARGDVGRSTPGLGLGLSVVTQATTRLHGQLQFFRDAAGHHARVTLPLS